jgi:hypothetical protein
VRPDPRALGELVDGQPESGPRGTELGSDDRVLRRLDTVVVDDQGLDGVAGPGDRSYSVAPGHGVLDQVHAAGPA